jgi:hypothetical protein
MDTHPDRPDDLNELERRLSAWEPARRGLDPDSMLFAAGRASARRGRARFAWPALTGLLAALAVALGAWASAERAGRLALAHQLALRPAAPDPVAPPDPAGPAEPPPGEAPTPDSLLAAHRALEQGLEAWSPRAFRARTPRPPGPGPAVLQAGHRDALLDP